MANSSEDAKLQYFLQWLQVNGVELRGCNIKYSDSIKGFGIFSSHHHVSDGVLLVVPLDLAITPMRVLQDPLIGPECRAMFEEGEVDDRFLMIVYLMFERLRKNSSWKPYLDILPTTFGNTLWFTEDELQDLKGTTLFRATELRKQNLQSLYEEKVKDLVGKLLTLDGNAESEVSYEDFLWANSIFWTRALNIPLPQSYIFPNNPSVQGSTAFISRGDSRESTNCDSSEKQVDGEDRQSQVAGDTAASHQEATAWVEGLVPGIDFCNHDLKAAATWEVDETGSTAGVPYSMYLLSAGQDNFSSEKEISISYGNKGNEELLYLYGFVMKDNPDDYLMVHYPVEAMENTPCSEAKAQLLAAQKAELRCLLTRRLLHRGFFPPSTSDGEKNNSRDDGVCNYSWSGQRKIPSYINKIVFPEEFMSALRTVAMTEDELHQVCALLEELVASGGEKQPSEADVRAAIWEACGDSGALQLLVDLLNMKIMDLEEGTGTEECDTELLEKALCTEIPEDYKSRSAINGMSRNRLCSIIYRQGQKQLARLFHKEAEHILQLALTEGN